MSNIENEFQIVENEFQIFDDFKYIVYERADLCPNWPDIQMKCGTVCIIL